MSSVAIQNPPAEYYANLIKIGVVDPSSRLKVFYNKSGKSWVDHKINPAFTGLARTEQDSQKFVLDIWRDAFEACVSRVPENYPNKIEYIASPYFVDVVVMREAHRVWTQMDSAAYEGLQHEDNTIRSPGFADPGIVEKVDEVAYYNDDNVCIAHYH